MAIVEILPPHSTPSGMTYSAAVYTSNGEHVLLCATVSEGLRRRMAAGASRAMAWARDHVRLPAGPIMDLMSGAAPDCGCDSVGEAFRAACLEAAEIAEDAIGEGAQINGSELVWSFDDWDGMEAQFLPDVSAMAFDTFGAVTRQIAPRPAVSRGSPIQRGPLGTPGSRTPVGTVTPGLAALQTALRAILGH
jgi:hypothetical protein